MDRKVSFVIMVLVSFWEHYYKRNLPTHSFLYSEWERALKTTMKAQQRQRTSSITSLNSSAAVSFLPTIIEACVTQEISKNNFVT